MRFAHPLPTLSAQTRRLSQFALSGAQMVFVRRTTAFGNLPRVSVQRVAVLPDQIDLITFNRQHADSDMLEMDNAIDARRSIRSDDLIFAHTDPRVVVNRARTQRAPRVRCL